MTREASKIERAAIALADADNRIWSGTSDRTKEMYRGFVVVVIEAYEGEDQ